VAITADALTRERTRVRRARGHFIKAERALLDALRATHASHDAMGKLVTMAAEDPSMRGQAARGELIRLAEAWNATKPKGAG
jgi:hypothetical protein